MSHSMNQLSVFDAPNQRKTEDKLLWAFAIDATRPLKTTKNRVKRAAQPKYKLHMYTLMSCSPRLRQAGVRVGMRYDEAKALVPGMRIFVYNR